MENNTSVCFVIPGEPYGKGRPRFSNAGAYVRTYTPEKTASYENLVKLTYSRQCAGFRFAKETALDVRIMAYYKIPKSAGKKKAQLMREKAIRPTVKPDYDNIGKIVCDALNGIAYHDDAQIVDAMIRKFYSDTPRVQVIIQSVNQNQKEEHEHE